MVASIASTDLLCGLSVMVLWAVRMGVVVWVNAFCGGLHGQGS